MSTCQQLALHVNNLTSQVIYCLTILLDFVTVCVTKYGGVPPQETPHCQPSSNNPRPACKQNNSAIELDSLQISYNNIEHINFVLTVRYQLKCNNLRQLHVNKPTRLSVSIVTVLHFVSYQYMGYYIIIACLAVVEEGKHCVLCWLREIPAKRSQLAITIVHAWPILSIRLHGYG